MGCALFLQADWSGYFGGIGYSGWLGRARAPGFCFCGAVLGVGGIPCGFEIFLIWLSICHAGFVEDKVLYIRY